MIIGETMAGRTGGNPELVRHQFKTEREEPCSDRLQIRMPTSMVERIKSKPGWQEWIREIIAEKLENSV